MAMDWLQCLLHLDYVLNYKHFYTIFIITAFAIHDFVTSGEVYSSTSACKFLLSVESVDVNPKSSLVKAERAEATFWEAIAADTFAC